MVEKDYNKVFRVYLAGPLNAENAVGYIKNLHKMIKKGSELIKAGYSVFIPGIDMLAGVVDGGWSYADYFDNSQPWLIASHCVYLMPGWQGSKGALREIEIANTNNIPVVDNDEDLVYYKEMYDEVVQVNEECAICTETEFEEEPINMNDLFEELEKSIMDSYGSEEEGKKYDQDKLRYDLIPIEAVEGIAQIFTHGAKKYGDNNWQKVRPSIRYYAAAMRHIAEVLKGKSVDPDSGLPHIDHAIVSLIMFRELTKDSNKVE